MKTPRNALPRLLSVLILVTLLTGCGRSPAARKADFSEIPSLAQALGVDESTIAVTKNTDQAYAYCFHTDDISFGDPKAQAYFQALEAAGFELRAQEVVRQENEDMLLEHRDYQREGETVTITHIADYAAYALKPPNPEAIFRWGKNIRVEVQTNAR